MDVRGHPDLVRRELPRVRSQGPVTRYLSRPHAAGNGSTLDGGPRVGYIDRARCHARALHHGSEHGPVAPYRALVRLCVPRTCADTLPIRLGLKLLGILAGSALVGFTVRRMAGLAAVERQKDRIDGFNILVMFVFVSAMMESVAARFLAAPIITIGLAALAFLVAFAVLCLTTLLFASAGRERAITLGFTASQRNTGLMLAATAGALPDLSWLYSAFTYFPLYLLPLLLHPLARRIIARAQTTVTPYERQPDEKSTEV